MHHTDRDFVLLLIIVYVFTFIALSQSFRPPTQHKFIAGIVAISAVIGVPLLSYVASFIWPKSIEMVKYHLLLCVLAIIMCGGYMILKIFI